ncbi:MAG: endonuclease/exonuclease/phosphatase family protein [Lautropia sp.]|nr:endonuclease/exonuclease/phosphatase family protein [Lautropia sp.]
MTLTDWGLYALLFIPVLATCMPFLTHTHWTVRVFDFPRVQIAFLALLALLLAPLLVPGGHPWLLALVMVLNLVCLALQVWEISAYTPLMKPQVVAYNGPHDGRSISLMASNVLTPNRRADKLLALVEKWQPDVLLTLETDKWWEEQLSPLEKSYPYTVKVPLDNLYGMHLYSRLPLRDIEIRHWVQEDIPSIHGEVQLRSGDWIELYCLHPMPPTPTESETSTNRDAELLLVGQEISASNRPVMVFGDLNDVAWSSTSRLFQKTSGLVDPRVGRGLYSTFHAKYPLLRWPLDHIFHSGDFMMREVRVLPGINSDHFPIYGSFQYHPAAEHLNDTPEADADDHEKAQEKIDDADPEKKVIREKY